MKITRKINLALKFNENIQNLIRFADSKISILSFISGIATSFVITNFQQMFGLSLFSKIILVSFFVCFFLFVFFSLKTISPRTEQHSDKLDSGIMYFGHISKYKVDDFVAEYENISDENFLTQVLYQVYENAQIAEVKFKNYKKGLITLQFQIFFFFILLMMNSFF